MTKGAYVVFNKIAVTGTNSYRSDPIGLSSCNSFSVHFVWDSTQTGTFTIWRTNRPDANTDGTADTGWDVVPSTEVDLTGKHPTGSASQSFTEISRVSAWKYRLKYVNATSSGNIYAYVHIPPAR